MAGRHHTDRLRVRRRYGTAGMNDNYKGLLSDDDKRIKEVLRELQATRRSTSPSDDVCAAVDAFLRQLGG